MAERQLSKVRSLEDFLDIEPKFPVPGLNSNPEEPDLRPTNWFNDKQLKFLQEFAKTLDAQMAAKTVGWNPQYTHRIMQEQKMRDEIHAIYDAWRKALRLTAEHSASRFISILDKVEASFDAGNDKVANALANLAGNYLKATGHFDKHQNGGTTAPQIQFNINLKDSGKKPVVQTRREENLQVVDITPESAT